MSSQLTPLLTLTPELIALNKPSGLPTAPTRDPKRLSLYHLALQRLAQEDRSSDALEPYVRVVHRLDAGTSGVVVMSRTPEGTKALALAFERREVKKLYWALSSRLPRGLTLEGARAFSQPLELLRWAEALSHEGVSPLELLEERAREPRDARPSTAPERSAWLHLSAPMRAARPTEGDARSKKQHDKKQQDKRQRWEVTRSGGKPAHSDFRLLAYAPSLYLIAARPSTGRTHQLRVHLASLGAPLLGDELYNPNPKRPRELHKLPLLDRLCLHARALELPRLEREGGELLSDALTLTAPLRLLR